MHKTFPLAMYYVRLFCPCLGQSVLIHYMHLLILMFSRTWGAWRSWGLQHAPPIRSTHTEAGEARLTCSA